jgi:DNA-binding transcriptional LysR family regulator
LLLREEGSATREIAEAILLREGIRPSKVVMLSNAEAIKRAVMAGMGVPFLSKFTVKLELEHKVLVTSDASQLKAVRQFFVIYSKGARLSPAVLGFLSQMRKDRH